MLRNPWLHLKFQEVEQRCDSVIYYDVYYQYNIKTIFIWEEVVYLNFRAFRNVLWSKSGPNQIIHEHSLFVQFEDSRNRCILAVLMLYVIKFFMPIMRYDISYKFFLIIWFISLVFTISLSFQWRRLFEKSEANLQSLEKYLYLILLLICITWKNYTGSI